MPVDVVRTLREALSKLTTEKRRIDRQVAAIQGALRAVNGASGSQTATGARTGTHRAKPRRRPMSTAARKALSARMKAYWAKRRAGVGKRRRKAA